MKTTVTKTRRSADHRLHLALTIMTCGLWALVWPIVAVIGKRSKIQTIMWTDHTDTVRSRELWTPKPGWYPGPHGYIFWDGERWTHDSQGRRMF